MRLLLKGDREWTLLHANVGLDDEPTFDFQVGDVIIDVLAR